MTKKIYLETLKSVLGRSILHYSFYYTLLLNIPVQDYVSKSNIRRATKRYEVKDCHLCYKKRLFIKDKERQMGIIRDVHWGIGDSKHSKAMALHRGKSTTYDKIAHRIFWHNIAADVNEYDISCEQCQK